MVELQIVVLAVAGSSPVGHPTRAFARETRISKSEANLATFRISDFALRICGGKRLAYALLKGSFVINPSALERARPADSWDGFWVRLLADEELRGYDDLQKLVIGCEIIAALDAVDLLAA